MPRLVAASCGAIVVVAVGLVAAADEARTETAWTVKGALKQIDRALRDLRGVTAEVEWDEWFESYRFEGRGQVWVSLDGRLCAEVAGGVVPESKEARAAVSTIMLWVDMATWLPAQQMIRHVGGMQVTARYADVTPRNDLPEERFRPTWPAGTRVVRK